MGASKRKTEWSMNSETLNSLDRFVKLSFVSFVIVLLFFLLLYFSDWGSKGMGKSGGGRNSLIYIGPKHSN
jgi:hypothetical protein